MTDVIPPATASLPKRPELLAPAGDWECARAAVENGADAIYFGLDRFNARMRARNFTTADLPELLGYLHRRGVKGYVTFNTLIFANEMESAEEQLRAMIAAGVDAAIVQDIGICRLIRKLSADFPIHASTQMTITSAAGLKVARELGCDLVVLARECSLQEMEKLQAEQRAQGPGPLPLEVFVHGALCVAYSGQCLTSEALGGRSANRGECAQACRMPYELLCDGTPVPLGDRRYLLSPQDLAGLPVLSELVRVGIASLKIEGRLKTPEYVASVTRVYREALDAVVERSTPQEAPRAATERVWQQSRYELEMAFSRGLSTGWLNGINNQELVHARFGKKRGVLVGRTETIEPGRVSVRLVSPVKPGDGIVFDSGHPEQKEEGGRIYGVELDGPLSWLTFGQDTVDWSRVHRGDRVWKTSDPELQRRLRRSFSSEQPSFQRPIVWEVTGAVGAALWLKARDEQGREVSGCSVMPLQEAQRQPLTDQRLTDQLGRLGGTPYRLGQLINRLQGQVMLPMSELNRLRRQLVDQLDATRTNKPRWQLAPVEPKPEHRATQASPVSNPRLILLVRTMAQLETALEQDVGTIYCEFEDPKKYRDAVGLYRAARPESSSGQGDGIFLAPPRIYKTGEDWILRQVAAAEPDGILARNYDHLEWWCRASESAGKEEGTTPPVDRPGTGKTFRCVGDYSLNVANGLAAEFYRQRYGLERVTASYDLNMEQLESLLLSAPPVWFEITLHQHMPLFHMEHCVFCAFLSTGTDYTNCGRPCDRHTVRLRDRVGAEHWLKADAGCRNTLFNSRAQSGAEYAGRLAELGVGWFRVELMEESPEAVRRLVCNYRSLLAGELSGRQLWQELKLHNQLGVTRGSF